MEKYFFSILSFFSYKKIRIMCSQEIIQKFFTNDFFLISKEKKKETENFLNEYGYSDLLLCAENKKDVTHVIYIVEPNEWVFLKNEDPTVNFYTIKPILVVGYII